MAAARAFAAQRPAAQSLGVVTFIATPRSCSQPTTDGDTRSRSALSTDADAARAAPTSTTRCSRPRCPARSRQVRRRGGRRAVRRARPRQHRHRRRGRGRGRARARARLHGRSALQLLRPRDARGSSRTASGEYLGAATGARSPGSTAISGGQLANAYVVHYRSTAARGLDGGRDAPRRPGRSRAVAQYRAPSLRVRRALAPRGDRRPRSSRRSSIRPPGSRSRRSRRCSLRSSSSGCCMSARRASRDVRASASRTTARRAGAPPADARGGRVARPAHPARAVRTQLAEALELGRIDMTPGGVHRSSRGSRSGRSRAIAVALHRGSMLIALVRADRRSRSPRARSCGAVSPPSARPSPTSFPTRCRPSRPPCGPGTASSVRSAQLTEDGGEPTRTEFARVVADERIGVPLETALQETRRAHGQPRPRAGRARRGAAARDRRQRRGGARPRRREPPRARRGPAPRDEPHVAGPAEPAGFSPGFRSRWRCVLDAALPGDMDPLFNTTAGHSLLVLTLRPRAPRLAPGSSASSTSRSEEPP